MFTIGESQAISHANRTANTRTPNFQYSQGKIWHRKILWSENDDLKFLFKGASKRWRQHQQTAEQREHHSMNVELLKYFTSKWKRFWIISLNISANIAVTKPALLADEFIPYRPRLLGFHSLHVHEVHVRWGFTVETAVILLKNMFEFTFNKARRV